MHPGPTIVIGDFNVDFTIPNDLSNFLKNEELTQIVDQPTHTEGGKIDHCYVSDQLKDTISVDYIFRYYTDHLAICVSFSNKKE